MMSATKNDGAEKPAYSTDETQQKAATPPSWVDGPMCHACPTIFSTTTHPPCPALPLHSKDFLPY